MQTESEHGHDHEHSGEHPLIQVIERPPLPGRRWFAIGWVLAGVALILAVLLIGLPLRSYLETQRRSDLELACRNRIGNALQESQARLISDLAAGLTAVVREDENVEQVLSEIDRDRDRVRELGDLRAQSIELCELDPAMQVPAPGTPP